MKLFMNGRIKYANYFNKNWLKDVQISKKQDLVAAITREAVSILGVEPEWVTVVIDEYSRTNWATAGKLHSLKYGAGSGQTGNRQKVR